MTEETQTRQAAETPGAAPPAAPAANEPGSEAAGASADPAALLQRINKMSRQLLQDTSTLTQTSAALNQNVLDGLAKLQAALSMVARQAVTTDVRSNEAALETRRLISSLFDGLNERLSGELLDRVVQQLLLGVVADILDDVDKILANAGRKERSTPLYTAVHLIRNRLLSSLRPFGVEQIPVTPGETTFNEVEHECTRAEGTLSAERRAVVTQIYRHGYLLRGRPVRRAQVVVKGV